MAHYIFNVVAEDTANGPALCERAVQLLRLRRWDIDAGERHHEALTTGDLVLIYAGAPARAFVGRAALASPVHEGGVSLADIQEWTPPVPMAPVLSQIDRSGGARADFDAGVVRITATEYETALTVAAGLSSGTATPLE